MEGGATCYQGISTCEFKLVLILYLYGFSEALILHKELEVSFVRPFVKLTRCWYLNDQNRDSKRKKERKLILLILDSAK